MSPKASLLLSTYEMPRHLALVLEALARQSTADFEILICDDGSGEQTKRLATEFAARAPVQVRHLWQEHRGFRKSRILNQAGREAAGEVLVFLDGDCVPHREFIADHLREQERGFYLAGRRVELGQEISAWLTPETVRRGFFDWPHPRLIWSMLRGDSEFPQRSVRIGSKRLRSWLGMDRVADLKGCNFSIPRDAFDSLDGFDEEYEGYGREDTDVEIRLQNLGFKIKSLKGVAIQFHVWHPRREFTPANDARLEELKKSGRVRAARGLSSDATPARSRST